MYDSTRDPIPAEVVAALAERLGPLPALEVGVGTGRVAHALGARGARVVGLDLSLPMMHRARAKGVGGLVRGTAYRLPFRDRAFGSTYFAHVLHLLDRPGPALAEARRVSREQVIALFHREDAISSDPPAEQRDRVRSEFFQRLKEAGHPVDPHAARPALKEQALLHRFPPDRLETLSEGTKVERATDRLEMVRQRALRRYDEVPAEVMERVVAEFRPRVAGWTATYRSSVLAAAWRCDGPAHRFE